MQLPLGAFGVMLRDYSFFYDDSGNLDIGGDRSRGPGGGKWRRKRRRRKLPSEWLKPNVDDDLYAREAAEKARSSLWGNMYLCGMFSLAVVYCVYKGRIPVMNIKLPIRAWFDPRKCKCRRIKH